MLCMKNHNAFKYFEFDLFLGVYLMEVIKRFKMFLYKDVHCSIIHIIGGGSPLCPGFVYSPLSLLTSLSD